MNANAIWSSILSIVFNLVIKLYSEFWLLVTERLFLFKRSQWFRVFHCFNGVQLSVRGIALIVMDKPGGENFYYLLEAIIKI